MKLRTCLTASLGAAFMFLASPVAIADGKQSCDGLVYAVHDGGINNTQLFTLNPLAGFKVAPLGPEYPGKNIEGLAIHPLTGELFGASGSDKSEAVGHLYQVNKFDGALSDLGPIHFEYEGTVLSGQDVSSLSFHPDGSLWGWTNECGLLQINAQTAAAELKLRFTSPEVCRSGKLPKNSIRVEDLTWDNQGKVIYAAAGNEVWAYTYQTGELKQVARLPAARHIETLKMLPEGLLLVGVHGSASLKAINPETGVMVGEVNINTSPYDDVEGVAWSSSCAFKVSTGTVAEGGNSNSGADTVEEVVPTVTKIEVDANTGGVLRVGDALVVEVPAGAVTQPTTLWVEEIKTVVEVLDSHTGQIMDKEGLSSIFKFGPEGTTFVIPVKAHLKYNPEAIMPGFTEEDIIALHNGKTIPRVLDTVTHTITANLNHFCNFTAALKYCQESSTVASEEGIQSWTCTKTLPFCLSTRKNEKGEQIAATFKYENNSSASGDFKCLGGEEKIEVDTKTIVVTVDRNLGGKYELRILADEKDIPASVTALSVKPLGYELVEDVINTRGTFRSQPVKTLAPNSLIDGVKPIVAINGSLFNGPHTYLDCESKWTLCEPQMYQTPTEGAFPSKTLIMDGVLKSRLKTNLANEVVMAFGGSKKGGSIPIQRLVKTENTFSQKFKDEFGVDFDAAEPQIELTTDGEKESIQRLPSEASKIPNSKKPNSGMRWAVGSPTTILRTDGSTLRCPYRDERFYDAVSDNLGDAVSAIGYSENHIVFLSSQFSDGIIGKIGTGKFHDYQHLCSVFRAFDTTDAIELDGGGSSQLVVEGVLKNREDKGVRHVVNAISLVALPVIENVEPKQVSQGSSILLEIYGENLSNCLVPKISGLKFSGSEGEELLFFQMISTMNDTVNNWEGYYPTKVVDTHIQVPVEVERDATPGYRNVQIQYGSDVVVLENAFEVIALPKEEPKQPVENPGEKNASCTFSDLNQVSSEFVEAINALCQKGIVQGRVNESGQRVYLPLNNATLFETVKVLVYASDIKQGKSCIACQWPETDSSKLNDPVTRSTAMAYLALVFNYKYTGAAADFLKGCGITNGDRLEESLTRGELAVLAYRAMQKECKVQ